MAEHTLSAEPTHSRWNRALPPRLTIASGDTVHLDCLDSSGAQVRPSMAVEEFLRIDRNRINALTGPIFVQGAEPGDVLQVDVLEVATGVAPGHVKLLVVATETPAAMIGFAGPRVIEQTIHQKLPEGFQRSEFLLEHGFLDAVVPRKDLKSFITNSLNLLMS